MVKFKKALSIALVSCMACSMFAGCNKSETTETTAEAEKNDETKAADETTEAAKQEETEAKEETKADEGSDKSSAEEMVQVLTGMTEDFENAKGYKFSSEINVEETTELDDETTTFAGTFTVDGMVDENGNEYVGIGMKSDDDDVISVNGTLLEMYVVDGVVYINANAVYDILEENAGEDYIEQYADAFGITVDDVKKLLSLEVEVPASLNSLQISDESKEALQKVATLIENDVTEALSKGDYVTVDGDSYTVAVNNDNVGQLALDVVNALDGNIGDIYDAYIDFMKTIDYDTIIDDVVNEVKDIAIDYYEKQTGEKFTDEQKEEIETELSDTIDEIKNSVDEVLAEMEDSKDDMLEEWESAMDEIADYDADGIKEELENQGMNIDATYTVTKEEDGYSISSTMEMTENSEESGNMSMSYSEVSSIWFDDDIEITAPSGCTSLEEYVDLAAQIYEKYQEMMAEQEETDVDDGDDDFDDDDSDVRSQEEIAEAYGVTLSDGQVIMTGDDDFDGAVIMDTPEGITMEPSDMFENCANGTDEEWNKIVYVWLFGPTYDKEYVDEYEDDYTALNDIYSYEVNDYGVCFYYFAGDYTASFDLTFYDEDELAAEMEKFNDDPESYLDSYTSLLTYVTVE